MISTTNVSMLAELANPSRHDTIAPDRSVDAMVVMVEVRGDMIDVRVKLYTVPCLVTCSMVPTGSLEDCGTLSISRPLKKSISQDRSVVVFTTHVNTTSVPGQLYALSALRVALPTICRLNIIVTNQKSSYQYVAGAATVTMWLQNTCMDD